MGLKDDHALFKKSPHAMKLKTVWIFGLQFIGNPSEMLTLVCDCLKRLDIEWQLIPKDLKMKCRTRIDENCLSEYEH